MKLLVIGSLLAVLFPLSSFFWEKPKAEVSAEIKKDIEGKGIRDTVEVKSTPVKEVVPETIEIVEEPTQVFSTPYSPPMPSPVASDQERLNTLASQIGVSVPVYAAACNVPGYDPTQVRGCYMPDKKVIHITRYALMYDDSYVHCILSHEARHAWQDANGMFNYQNGVLVNRDWLEADATAYSGCS